MRVPAQGCFRIGAHPLTTSHAERMSSGCSGALTLRGLDEPVADAAHRLEQIAGGAELLLVDKRSIKAGHGFVPPPVRA
jgi:hypothetical protein